MVELAICLPVLVLILLATIEACAMLQIQQNAVTSAYEGARIAIIPGVNAAIVTQQCEMLLNDRNISGYSIATSPADLSNLDVGDPVTVTVNVDCGANSIFGGNHFDGRTISESVVMLAE
jgi:hypothetical protein